MKVLEKLRFSEFIEMNDREMKWTTGGSGNEDSGAASLCDGRPTTLKCTVAGSGYEDVVMSQWSSIGCPETNQCPTGQFFSCSC